MQPKNNELAQIAAAAAALGVGSQQAPGLDVTKLAQMGMQQPPGEAWFPLISKFGDNPAAMERLIPQLRGMSEANAKPDMSAEIMAALKSPDRKPAQRIPVTSTKGQKAEAIVDDKGDIIGFAQPGSEELLKGFVPDAASVGGYPSFKYQMGDMMSHLFDFAKPSFNQPATKKY